MCVANEEALGGSDSMAGSGLGDQVTVTAPRVALDPAVGGTDWAWLEAHSIGIPPGPAYSTIPVPVEAQLDDPAELQPPEHPIRVHGSDACYYW